MIIFNSVKTSALCQNLEDRLQMVWGWCWGFSSLKRKRSSRIPCEKHSPFSSGKFHFFSSQGQHDNGREVTASTFHSLTSRAHCSVQKPGHVLISSVLCLKQPFVTAPVTTLGAIPRKRLNTFNCLWIHSAVLERYPWLAVSFSSSPALFHEL